MTEKLQILHLENSPHDAEIIRSTLRREGILCDVHRVASKQDYLAALEARKFDLILSDYSLPGFAGIPPLDVARECAPQTPFIFVSDAIGEERAIESIKNGARHYVLKNKLAGLATAVRRALDEEKAQRDRRTAEEALQRAREELEQRVNERTTDLEKTNRLLQQEIENRKKVEVNLHRAHRVLSQTVSRLQETNVRLQEVDRHKSRFLSSMSHELRTPLNSILGFADLLRGQHFGKLNAKQRSYVGQIENSGKHLLDLINDLLDIAKIDAGAIDVHLERFDLRECVEGVVSLFANQTRKKQLRTSVEVAAQLESVCADRRKCKQILLNLLSNAVKYTPEGGAIAIRAWLVHRTLRLEVEDTGPGISPDEQANIFSEFYQADRVRDEELGGTGIGLALTKRLVALQGGQIGVTSERGRGSTFWITLDQPGAPTEADQPSPARPHSVSIDTRTSGRILVAEDHPLNLAMMLDMLSLKDYEVAVARNGEEAVDLAQSFNPDVILMDIRMPVLDGLEAINQLRALPRFAQTPIVALTASADEQAVDDCFQAGCTEHVAKPIQSAALFALLERLLIRPSAARRPQPQSTI